jgi:hypothetical protein
VRGLGAGGPLLVEPAGRLQDRGGGAEPHRLACQAADASAPGPLGEPREPLRGGDMAVPTDQERGLGPVVTERGEEPDPAQRGLCARGSRARAEACHAQGP